MTMRQLLRTIALSAVAALVFASCADDLREDVGSPDATVNPDDPDASVLSGEIGHVDNGDGTTTTTVNATSHEDWIYLQFSSKAQTTPSGPEDSQEWDVAFRRFDLMLNGGVSGTGGMQVIVLPGQDFDALTEAPAGTYGTDEVDGDDDDSDPDLFFASEEGGWYDYDVSTHVLTPKEQVYVIRSSGGEYFKLRFLTYYDEAGTSGYLQFQWGEIEALPSVQSMTVDASADGTWIYLDMETGDTLSISSPETDLTWDLAVQRTRMRTNSGTSGAGAGGAVNVEEADLSAVMTAPTSGYIIDELLPLPGPPGSGEESGNASLATWYDYNPSTHVVSPHATSYVIRNADGGHSKIQITSYADGVFGLDWASAVGGEF